MEIVLYFVIGLCLGSFVNALVWRIKNKKDWVKARSVCVNCKHQLSVLDLIPVLSWMLLRAKCRYCKKPISVQYPVVELVTAGLFGACYHWWPYVLSSDISSWLPFAVWLVALVGLVAMAVYDLRWMIIPDKIIIPLIVLAISLTFVEAVFFDGGPERIRDSVLGLLVGGGFFFLVYQLSKGRWIGGGDVKLGIFLGILLGARDSFIALYAASIAGSLTMISLLIFRKVSRKSKIPFGPFLIAGIIVAKLFGESLYLWYATKFGL